MKKNILRNVVLVWLYFNPLLHILRPANLKPERGCEVIVRNGIHMQVYLNKDNEWAGYKGNWLLNASLKPFWCFFLLICQFKVLMAVE